MPHMQHNYCVVDVGWTYPAQDWIKCNKDGSMRGRGGSISCGGFFRDTSRKWIQGFGKNLGTDSVLTAELQAIYTALNLAMNLHIDKLSIESDSSVVVQLINNGFSPSHIFVHLLGNVKTLRGKNELILIE
ncbi:Ribonuclease H domain [Sesbania bispinosa]|nr:Ribonuclease H domain [Sesbania bispinosa]